MCNYICTKQKYLCFSIIIKLLFLISYFMRSTAINLFIIFQAGMTRSQPSFNEDVLSDGGSATTCCNSAPPSSSCKTSMSTSNYLPCSMCHVPYSDTSLPFKVKISKCGCCRKGKVADILFTTLELPSNLPILGLLFFLLFSYFIYINIWKLASHSEITP